jgi:hypothetical protein
MIKDLDCTDIQLTVKLKNGELFENKDVPPSPFGEHEKVVSFWHEDVLRSYPMSSVEYVEIIPQ